MLDALQEDHVRTARAKGMGPWDGASSSTPFATRGRPC